MAAPSALTRIAAVALVAGGLTFVAASWRDPGYARLQPAGGPVAAHRDAATFVVEAAPFSNIELTVNGRRAASAYVGWNARDVRFEDTPLEAGRNAVVARTTLWYAASRRAHTAELDVWNPPAPVAGRGAAARTARAAMRSAGWRYGRSLALAVRQQEVAVSFAVQLPSSDRAAVALRAGRIDLPAFVDDVFGGPRFNRRPIAGFFSGARTRFAATGDVVTASADSGYQGVGLDDLPAFAGDVEIANAFTGPKVRVAGSGDADRPPDTRPWARDVLRLWVQDYRVVDREPAPARADGAAMAWDRPFADARTHVVVSLAFAPFSSAGALRRGLNLPVFAFAPHVVARFLALFHGFVLAVPMFAYLALSRARNARFAVVARRLIAVAVAADVFDACISAQPDVDGEIRWLVPGMGALPASLVNLLFVPALIGFVLAAVASSVAHLAARARAARGALVADAANAVRMAALGFIAIVIVGYVAGSVARVPGPYPVLVGTALAAGLLAVLAALDWWTIPARAGSRRAFTAATVAFAAAVAVPVALVPFGVWATIPEHAGTAFADPLSPLPLTAAFLRSLAPLCPLVFGLLLIAGVRPDPAALGLDRARFARLVLCCYAVLPGVIVLMPLGFALAWLTYDVLRARDGMPAGARDGGTFAATPRERGTAVIPLALAFVLAEVLVLLPSELQYLREVHTPFVALEAAGFLAVIVASFVIPAFAFAACSDELAGGSGLRKGLDVAGWVLACSLPAWLLHADSVVTAVAVAAVTALFYAVLGRVTRSSRAGSPRVPDAVSPHLSFR